MKRKLSLICLAVYLLCALFSTGTALAGTHTVTLNVDFEKNLMFSKYDVDVFLDTAKIGTYDHGRDFSVSFQADDGNHTVWFYDHDDNSKRGSIEVAVSSDTVISCGIECKNNKVNVSKVEIERDTSSSRSLDIPQDDEPAEEVKPAGSSSGGNDVGNTKITKDGVSVTLVGFRESKGDSFMAPESGKTYVLLEFLIENNSNDDLTVSSLLDFDAYCDGFTCEYSFGANMAASQSLDGSVAPGKKMKGEIGFEVPKDWKEMELQIKLNLWSDEKLVFVIQNK